ncbi:hypothetical protein [Actinoplanes siamensis]|uniref:Uncharacterized protein n=1 Tax=Actinoplanes siamensis TaxID=1223317 RepID=A0A919NFE4_9ACTN|nr:hypothetical protein [Actinoplanes siamensis]GIF09871.1 hypothetical protein Asi03nite_74090 [Actinoplanes siamensis]
MNAFGEQVEIRQLGVVDTGPAALNAVVAATADNAAVTLRIGKPWWITGVVAGLGVLAVAVALARAGLEDADRWSSVISMFLGTAGLALSVYSTVKARGDVPGNKDRVHNTVTDTSVRGPALLGRDVHIAGARPASATQSPSEVRNHVRGGTFHGPLIMGRDIEDITLPPTSTGERHISGAAE